MSTSPVTVPSQTKALSDRLYLRLIEAFQTEPNFSVHKFTSCGQGPITVVGMNPENPQESRYGYMRYAEVALCRIGSKTMFLARGAPVGAPAQYLGGDIFVGAIERSRIVRAAFANGVEGVIRDAIVKNSYLCKSACVELAGGYLAINVAGNPLGQRVHEAAMAAGIPVLNKVPTWDDPARFAETTYSDEQVDIIALAVFAALGEL